MHFSLVDRIIEKDGSADAGGRVVTLKLVSSAEEYLQDHFPTFPVLPGVLMLEAMVQAARALIDPEGDRPEPVVLGRVRTLKYGRFVKPGDTMRIEVSVGAPADGAGGVWDCKGTVTVHDPVAEPATACTGRFTVRPAVRTG